jgi:hypothetical protein
MITVHLPPDLAVEFDIAPTLRLRAGSLEEMVDRLDQEAPGIRSWLSESDGRFRQHLSIFVDGRRLAPRSPATQPLSDNIEVWILRAISGG